MRYCFTPKRLSVIQPVDRLPMSKRVAIVSALVEGSSLRSTFHVWTIEELSGLMGRRSAQAAV